MTRHFKHYMNAGPSEDEYGPAGRGHHRRGRGAGPRPPWGGGPRGGRGPRGPWVEGDGPRSEWGWDGETPDWGDGTGRGGAPGGPGWGGGPGRNGGPGRPGRGRGRRGDVRQAVLRVVAEQPSTGYQIMAAIASKSQDLWRPGPGSVYPALQSMTDEGLVSCQESEDGRKVYTITEDGRKRLAEAPEKAPWERMAHDMAGALALRPAMESLRGAVAQVAQSGTDAQRRRAKELLDATRRRIYLILAGDDEETGAPDDEDSDGTAQAPDGAPDEG